MLEGGRERVTETKREIKIQLEGERVWRQGCKDRMVSLNGETNRNKKKLKEAHPLK